LGVFAANAIVKTAVGEHSQARDSIGFIESLSLELNTDEPKILAVANEIELDLATGETVDLAAKLDDFQRYFEDNMESLTYLYGEALPIMIRAYLSLNDIEAVHKLLAAYQSYTTDNTVVLHRWQTLQAQLLIKQNKQAAAEQLLEQAIKGFVAKQHWADALKATFVWLDLDQ